MRRLPKALLAIGMVIALIAGLAACEIRDSQDVSSIWINKTCDSYGNGHVDIKATVRPDAGQNYNIIISINNGWHTTGQSNVTPGGSLSTSRDFNATEADISFTPSDGTGDSDFYEQPIGACTV